MEKKPENLETYEELKIFIENSEKPEERIEAIEKLIKIEKKNESSFEFFENLVISDENETIRLRSAAFLIENYEDKAKETLFHVFSNENSIDLLELLFSFLVKLDENKVQEQIIHLIREAITKNTKYFQLCFKNSKIQVEEFIDLVKSNSTSEIFSIYSNYRIIDYYIQNKYIWESSIYNLIDQTYEISKSGYVIRLRFSTSKVSFSSISQIKYLEKLTHLKDLSIQDVSEFNSLKGIEQLPNLTTLTIKNSNLNDFMLLENLKNLETLDLSFNQFKEINLEKFKSLKFLSLACNPLKSISGFETLKQLSEIVILEDQHYKTPDFKKINQTLQKNRYFGGKVFLSEEVQLLESLESLLKERFIRTRPLIPQNFTHISSARDINQSHLAFRVSRNRVSALFFFFVDFSQQKGGIPDILQQFLKLTELSCCNTRIGLLPEWLPNIPLKKLILDDNQLRALPDWIDKLSDLTELSAKNNLFWSIPDSITRLRSLKRLILSGNPLVSLPGNLISMETLDTLDTYYYDRSYPTKRKTYKIKCDAIISFSHLPLLLRMIEKKYKDSRFKEKIDEITPHLKRIPYLVESGKESEALELLRKYCERGLGGWPYTGKDADKRIYYDYWEHRFYHRTVRNKLFSLLDQLKEERDVVAFGELSQSVNNNIILPYLLEAFNTGRFKGKLDIEKKLIYFNEGLEEEPTPQEGISEGNTLELKKTFLDSIHLPENCETIVKEWNIVLGASPQRLGPYKAVIMTILEENFTEWMKNKDDE